MANEQSANKRNQEASKRVAEDSTTRLMIIDSFTKAAAKAGFAPEGHKLPATIATSLLSHG